MEMVSIDQIRQIKLLQAQGWKPGLIAQKLRLDRKTVRKYLQQEDFSPTLPQTAAQVSPSMPKRLEIGQLFQQRGFHKETAP